MGEGGCFHTHAKLTQVAGLIFCLDAQTHGLLQFLLTHATTIILDPADDLSISETEGYVHMGGCHFFRNGIVYHIGYRRIQIISKSSERLKRSRGVGDAFYNFH